MSTYLGFTPTTDNDFYFVSYNTGDADRIGPILQELNRRGASLWYDYGLEYGEEWEVAITDKIEECKEVLMFITRNIYEKESSYVKKEYQIAKKRFEKKINIIILDEIKDSDIPNKMLSWWYDLMEEQCICAYNLNEQNLFLEFERMIELKQKNHYLIAEDGTRYELANANNYIGRSPRKSNIVLQDEMVSNIHALISVGHISKITDLGAMCGTFINGNRINAHECYDLNNNDEICFGRVLLTYVES